MDIESVKKKYEEQLMRLPNVTGVGIGEKAGKKVIHVYVTSKVPVTALQPDDVIPKALDGWEVVVEEIGTVSLL